MHILIADDHQLFRKSLCKLLLSFDEVEEAANGKEALAVLSTQRIDLIFLDVRMPEMDGFDACKQIFKEHPYAKVIILTMYDSKPIILHFIQLGVKSFLTKNVDPKEVQIAIREVMKGGCYFPDEILHIIKNSLSHLNTISNLQLSEKEKNILTFLERGLTSKELAQQMQLSTKTISSYRERLLFKTQTKNVAELISWGYKNGILN